MIFSVPPRGQREETRRQIERRIAELEALMVPGLQAFTASTLREQILALEGQLKPDDDKRNPAYYRAKPSRSESWPVRRWNREDWLAACWGARERSAGACELCAAAAGAVFRLVRYPENHQIKREHVQAVCRDCDNRFPIPERSPFCGVTL